MIHLSVVVPFYNAERTIAQCIDGLLSQDFPAERYEVLMVDNNSTDASTEIVRAYPRIRLAHEPRQGAYAARNRGVSQAKGEVLAFTDPDCVPSGDWLREISRAMCEPRVGIVLGSSLPARDSAAVSMLAAYENAKNEFIFGSGQKALYYGWTRNMAVRKGLFDEIGPFVERARGSDVILVRRCVDRYSCDLVRYSPAVQIRHLEIRSAGDYFRKVLVYGRSSREYRQVVNARPLSSLERWLVFRNTVRGRGYSRTRSLLLLGLLGVGLLYWALGSLSALRPGASGQWPVVGGQ